MFTRTRLAIATAIVSAGLAAGVAFTQSAPDAATATSSVLERYTGRYALNGAVAAVTVTADGLLSVQLEGQPQVPPMRQVSTNEFMNDTVGVRIFFDGDGPKTTTIRSVFNGQEVIGSRVADGQPRTVPRSPNGTPLDATARQEVVTQLATALRDRYVFPDVAERAATRIEAALAAGEYDDLSDSGAFAARLGEDVNAIAHDKHLSVTSLNAPPPPPPGAGIAMPRAEGGVVRADRLPGGIGYLEVIAFPRPAGFRPALDPAMERLAGSKALIFDLRRNLGGAPEGVIYMASFLMPPGRSVHINDIVTRVAGTQDFTRQAYNSQPTPVSFAGRPVYILTSGDTFSGGEAFAYDVRALGRGVIVGEVTGGGGNLTGPAMLGNGLAAMIPMARAENAVTKGNWEGHGVEPDIPVPAANALAEALERLGQSPVADIEEASLERIFTPRGMPLPGTEAALRSLLTGLVKDQPELSALGSGQAEMMRGQLPELQNLLRPMGPIRSIRFREPGLPAGDTFDVTFASGSLAITVMPGEDGKLVGIQLLPGRPGG